MFYEEIVYRHFENPSNVGVIMSPTHTAMVGNPATGAVIKLVAKVENNIIQNIMFKAYGGGAIIACMSLLTEKVKGKSIEEALLIRSNDLILELKLEPVKMISAILSIDALHQLFNINL